MATRYNVYFAGQLLEGQELTSVRDKLAKLFNADQQTLDKLFSGKAQLLKRECDKATAVKYKEAMERAGAQPIIKASQPAAAEESPQPTPVPEKTLSAAQRIAALAAAPDEGGYSSEHSSTSAAEQQPTADREGINLAPAGTDVLREDERNEPVIREVDTAGLAVDATAQRLSEEPPPPPMAPDTSHLDMGDVGETIPNLPADQVPLSPNTDAIGLSPRGTDFTDCAPLEAEAPPLDLSGMDLAPAGMDVLEERYRKKELAEAPSIDHISLEE
ncbi:MAG: hypothetical protein DRR04_00055 [Gammaproteobacteria bacterium]|nr:MAG: hypothetical protein DRQ97_00480 [Gammaproteobacteria bacterium]RLA62399.1 MAG: hypothetical protein DRR04_00055 [Gammaproteobacteria bacterium]